MNDRAGWLLKADRAGWMENLGARVAEAEPGRVVIELEAGPQHRHGGGVVQGGVITQIADAAMGMTLATLQEDENWNTTIELKINFRDAPDSAVRRSGRRRRSGPPRGASVVHVHGRAAWTGA